MPPPPSVVPQHQRSETESTALPPPPPSTTEAMVRGSGGYGDGDPSGVAGEKRKKRPRASPRQDKEKQAPQGAASSGAAGANGGETAKPRKPTYLLQKEERDVLVEEMRVLEEQLETLKLRVGLPTKDDHAAVESVRTRNFEMEEQIHSSRLFLAKLQSFVMQELHTPPVDPLAMYIHLPKDTDERRRILRDLRETKLQRAERVAHERLHHLDHSQAYLSDERFTTDDGIYHSHRLEINQFPNFKSARQLYDAMTIFFYNWEISVSEMLNQLAIREDSDEIDPTIWNQRIVTVADDVGCPEELNTVVFARFRSDDHVGIITHDTVDVDDLYPYQPLERTCKFFQTVHLVYELELPGSAHRVPILKSMSFVKQLPPQFPLAPGVEDKLHENMARWPITLIKFLRSYSSTAPPPPPGEI